MDAYRLKLLLPLSEEQEEQRRVRAAIQTDKWGYPMDPAQASSGIDSLLQAAAEIEASV